MTKRGAEGRKASGRDGDKPAGTSPASDEQMLDTLQRESFEYFLKEADPATGLVADKTGEQSPASIASTGLALAAYPVGVERGFLEREDAVARMRTTLRFFRDSLQGPEPSATGHKGFYYHFLDMKTGRRARQCELSTIDSALLLAGALAAARYCDRDTEEEDTVRRLADELYRRVDWRWALNGGVSLCHGWTPETGFLEYRWEGYDEALLLYVLGLGSPTHPLPRESYDAWTSTYAWKRICGQELLYAGPLFSHQLSHAWIDFHDLRDAFMRERGLDYFENSRRATYVQRQYAIRNPSQFEGYGATCWGISASDGPGPATMEVNGIQRTFFDYVARGVPFGPDDGTIAPWAAVASLPFAPEIVIPTIRHFLEQVRLGRGGYYGFAATFNLTFPGNDPRKPGWVSTYNYGLNQGPIVMMIENRRSELIWRLMRGCSYVRAGLGRAGFRGGWL